MDEHEFASQVLVIVDEAAYRNAASRVSTIHLADAVCSISIVCKRFLPSLLAVPSWKARTFL